MTDSRLSQPSPLTDPAMLAELSHNARSTLLSARAASGYWEGELSNSALSTATAVFALHLFQPFSKESERDRHRTMIMGGLRWLVEHQNADGGWGDTVLSFSNISTTALVWGVLNIPDAAEYGETTAKAEAWLTREAGSLDAKSLSTAIARRYGKDRTFSVPILTMLALADRLGPDGWRHVPQLPFELAACPFRWFQWLQLPVVSYALPALIAIGQVKHRKRPTWNPASRLVRQMTSARTLRLLREIQPTTGGYLEATPLTSFVTMSLIGGGLADHPVVGHAIEFLERSVRPDGSWPIDTNLATWVTTLSVNALGDTALSLEEQATIRTWLLGQQYRVEHPYTHAAPGGWAWTDLSGGVPDADDTPGALLALAKLGPDDADVPVGQVGNLPHENSEVVAAVTAGTTWLLDLQNADGGIPTFCRGWTGLPFDRGSADLTAHTLLAWAAWFDRVDTTLQSRIEAAMAKATRYLIRTQRSDGSWAPLWFGTQHVPEPDVANLTYGTSRVVRLAGTRIGSAVPGWDEALRKGANWLIQSQGPDGGWGGRPATSPSIEETALALETLANVPASADRDGAIAAGIHWLAAATERGTRFDPAPIGFYFANLWYFEKLYPIIFTVAAVTRLTGR